MLAIELCGASIHPGGPLLAQPDPKPSYSGPYADLVPRSRHSDLRQAYLEQCLDLFDPGAEWLSQELRQEDRVQAEFQRLLRGDPNGYRWASSYAEPLAFAGGGSQLVRQVEICTALVEASAAGTTAGVPRFFCGLLPGLGLGARSHPVKEGVIVMLDTGFLAALRILTQTIAASLRTIDHFPESLVDGDLHVDGQYGSLTDLLDRCRAGRDVRDDPIQISLHTGPQDHLRRHLMVSAICQLIAHEVGHWSRSRPGPNGTWVPDNAEFQRGARLTSMEQWAHPIDETDELATGLAEAHADSIACEIQMQPPLWSGMPTHGQVVGAMSALALHAGLWWQRAAHTDEDLGWTHPIADHRMSTVRLLLSGQMATNLPAPEPGSPADTAWRFERWAKAMLDIDQNRASALQHGLENRGVATMERARIAMTQYLEEAG